MAKYRLVEWEDNRYHDSYGKLVYFDDQTNKLHITEHWSTAYPGGADMTEFLFPTKEILEKAQHALALEIFDMLATDIHFAIVSPDYSVLKAAAQDRNVVVLKKDFNGRKQGKFKKGTKFEIVDVAVSMYTPSWKKNKTNADYNAKLRAQDGSFVWLSCDKLQMDRPMPTEKEVMQMAERRAKTNCFSVPFGGCAWLSTDWTQEVA